jgi:hypothetical protein
MLRDLPDLLLESVVSKSLKMERKRNVSAKIENLESLRRVTSPGDSTSHLKRPNRLQLPKNLKAKAKLKRRKRRRLTTKLMEMVIFKMVTQMLSKIMSHSAAPSPSL